MTRTRLRFTVLALAAVVLFAIAPAYAYDGPGERSPLEDPAPVFDVTLSLTGSDMMDVVTELGIEPRSSSSGASAQPSRVGGGSGSAGFVAGSAEGAGPPSVSATAATTPTSASPAAASATSRLRSSPLTTRS